MKSLIIGLLCATMAGTATQNTTSDTDYIPTNNIFIPNRDRSITETVISGDANCDGKLNIADAVILQSYLTKDFNEVNDLSRLDINFDGIIDSFDVIVMRQTILHPEEAVERVYSIDMLNSADSFTQHDGIFTNSEEVSSYLSEFISDPTEVQKYLDRYDSTFFEENNLVLVPIMQERGKGIYYDITGFGKIRPNPKARVAGTELFLSLSTNYDAYKMIYPVTNTPLLVQASIPKYQSSENDYVSVFDESENTTNMSSHTYFSPDGTEEIIITQETIGDLSDIRVFRRTGKISFQALTYMAGRGEKPFKDEGEWYVDDEGNDVFGNETTYSITWLDNAITIEHLISNDNWEKVYIPFDSDNLTSEYYKKS